MQEERARPQAAKAGWPRRALTGLLGLVALVFGLSLVATAPIVQLAALGYLLHAGGRVAASGRLRDGLPGLATAARVGAAALGIWLLLWIPRLVASLARSSWLIDPAGAGARWLGGLAVALLVLVLLHVVAASARGGLLRHYLVPRPRREARALRALCSREGYARARDVVWDTLQSTRALALLWLGARGLLLGALWLLVPTTLLAIGARAPLAATLGVLLTAGATLYLPFIQLRLAREDRLGVALELDVIHRAYAGAPLAMAASLLVTVGAALPLYLLKIELMPRELLWLPGALFVIFTLPARLLCGFALARGLARERPRHRALRALGWIMAIPIAALYGVLLYFTQHITWFGTWGLYEQHAFLLPTPLLGAWS
ncbi:MAG: hypothetical protein H6713_39210 [Myxococcales bacterium]|nr:hypothetical protein [Myxococcales bacterium]